MEKVKVLRNTLPSAGSLGLYLNSVSLGNVWEQSSERNKHKESSTGSSAVWKLFRNGGSSVKELWTGLELVVPPDMGVHCSGPAGIRPNGGFLALAGWPAVLHTLTCL